MTLPFSFYILDFMELKIYCKTKNSETFYKRTLPDEIISINLYLNNTNGGQIEYVYPHPNDGKNISRSDCLCFADDGVTYIEVNGKDKFVLRNRKDFIAFYKYLTDFDVDKFIKDFKAFDKEHNINDDF